MAHTRSTFYKDPSAGETDSKGLTCVRNEYQFWRYKYDGLFVQLQFPSPFVWNSGFFVNAILLYLLHKRTPIGHVVLFVQAVCRKETLAASTGHVWGFPALGRRQQKVIHHQLPRRQQSQTLQAARELVWLPSAAVWNPNALGNKRDSNNTGVPSGFQNKKGNGERNSSRYQSQALARVSGPAGPELLSHTEGQNTDALCYEQ